MSMDGPSPRERETVLCEPRLKTGITWKGWRIPKYVICYEENREYIGIKNTIPQNLKDLGGRKVGSGGKQ